MDAVPNPIFAEEDVGATDDQIPLQDSPPVRTSEIFPVLPQIPSTVATIGDIGFACDNEPETGKKVAVVEHPDRNANALNRTDNSFIFTLLDKFECIPCMTLGTLLVFQF
jgi:hypothetical protein